MDGVTDAPMRFITKKYGQADVIYTEFVSAEGLWRIKKRGEMDNKIWKDLIYDPTERPIVAQLFGSDPDSFYEATKIICELGFDGIDINMGCPSPGLEKRGGGAGLMKDQGLAAAVIEATRRGVKDFFCSVRTAPKPYSDLPLKRVPACVRLLASASVPDQKNLIPVSVKTRIGSTGPDESWWKFLAEQKLPVVAMHGRTFKQLYKGEADWESLLKASGIIRESGTRFLGNGDIKKFSDFNDQFSSRMDGVLIGRAAIGNPWALRKDGYEPTVEERLAVVIEHAKKYEEIFKELKESRTQGIKTGGKFQFFPMRKHLAWYARGFTEAGSLRRKLVVSNSAEEVSKIISDFLDISPN